MCLLAYVVFVAALLLHYSLLVFTTFVTFWIVADCIVILLTFMFELLWFVLLFGV